MSIEENRRKQRRELYGKFVSVNALVNALADAENTDPSEVAAALLVMFEGEDDKKPAFGSIDAVRIKFGQHEFRDPEKDQKEVLSEDLWTIAKGYKCDGDDFGWLSDDLLPFLRANGFERPVHFPAWNPPEDTKTNEEIQGVAQANFSDRIQGIESDTFNRLIRAIEAFTVKYPNYKSSPPKLTEGVRDWLHEVGLVKDGKKGREAHIFGKIIAEHFKL